MITSATSSVSSSDISTTLRSGRSENLKSVVHASEERRLGSQSDQVSAENTAFLRSELTRQPEIRPEVVARARALAADPNYPSMDILQSVAQQILNAPDLSEDRS